MKTPKKLIRSQVLGANFDRDGVTVELDWRYEMAMDYVRLSHSYKSVLMAMQGSPSIYPLPADYVVVEEVVKDFHSIGVIGEWNWWNTAGKELFGVRTPNLNVELIGRLDSTNTSTTTSWQELDALIVSIPVTMKPTKAIRQLKELLEQQNLPEQMPASLAPKYKITNAKMHRHRLNLGAAALGQYQRGRKLREIGRWLDQYAEGAYSDTATRRLISQAALIAENAARGRFFSSKPFAEALTETYRRKAGRPFGTTGIKWGKGRNIK